MNKKAFSFVEIIISISIIIILGIIATTTSNNLKNNSNNAKVISDLNTISNALTAYKNENKSIVMPGGNNNNYKIDGSYNHDFDDSETFGVYGSFTQDTLEKRYLDITPIDPRSNSYYSYGITKGSNFFEVAGVIGKKDNYVAKVIGDYTAENGLYSLIREYNGVNYVSDNGANLPYNPEEKQLIATTIDGTIYKEGDTITNNSGGDLEIFFSDGSTSIIGNNSELTLEKLDFPKENNLVSNIKLYLQAGSIWTNATRLGTESSFDVYTTDTTASVRGTIFQVVKQDLSTKVIVIEGEVEVKNMSSNLLIDVVKGNDAKILDVSENGTFTSGDISYVPSVYKPIFSTSGIQVNVTENTISTDVLAEENNKSCYLEGQEVKDGEIITAYNIEGGTDTRTCSGGVLGGGIDYKYSGTVGVEPPCNSFKIGTICQDGENNLKEDGWDLYAYAPYNNAGDINLYSSSTISKYQAAIILENPCSSSDNTGNCDINHTAYIGANTKDTQNSWASFTNGKGIFIDNVDTNDYLKYSGFSLGSDFAIEMRVLNVWKTQTGNKYVFDNQSGSGLIIGNNSYGIIDRIYYGGAYICNNLDTYTSNDCNLNLSTYGDFITITVKNGKNIKITDGNNNIDYPMTPSSSISNPTDIYIGSRKDSKLQINGVVDYVKIYKK